ncbi:MAG: hypothetical protein ACD_84C00011G0005 [uncultured bacterium]|nr:MAG: hypothetical protein ACD_84C00011G0005 [uncultured bacterium]
MSFGTGIPFVAKKTRLVTESMFLTIRYPLNDNADSICALVIGKEGEPIALLITCALSSLKPIALEPPDTVVVE